MDSFDLHWPNATATLYTDGAHVKIVVRDKRGPSGTINNIELCKDRVAFGLDFAPSLLDDLKARGYRDLADDIEQRVQPEPEVDDDPVGEWLERLSGDGTWEACGTKRSTKWHDLADGLCLKLPAKRGKQEWALRETPAEGKPTYLCAPELKGILCALGERENELVAAVVGALAELAGEHAEIEAAVAAWPKH